MNLFPFCFVYICRKTKQCITGGTVLFFSQRKLCPYVAIAACQMGFLTLLIQRNPFYFCFRLYALEAGKLFDGINGHF